MQIPVVDHQLKVPVVRRKEYTLFLEQANARTTFIHCDVHGLWKPWVKKQLIADWTTLKALHGGPFLALHTPGDAKHLKFLRMFGFKFALRFVQASDGRRMEIYTT